MGAMIFSWAVIIQKEKNYQHIYETIFQIRVEWQCWITLTNKNDGHSNEVGKDIAPEWFIVFAITLCKEYNVRVYVVFAQTLRDEIKYKHNFFNNNNVTTFTDAYITFFIVFLLILVRI